MSYTKETESIIEQKLITQLQGLGYEYVKISNEVELLSNLKKQLEIHNYPNLSKAGVKDLTDGEFKKVLNYLQGGSIIEKAEKLRNSTTIELENGNKVRISFLNMEANKWCQNEFQVTSQITMVGNNNKKNRYDVTLLINGLPISQIELKNKGISLTESFHQFIRYQSETFGTGIGLFNYIQLLISSNSTNTQYYANNTISQLDLKQRFTWTDKNNKKINELSQFTDDFLNPCDFARFISEDIVISTTKKMLMVLRPYQHYAYKAIIEKVNNTNLSTTNKDLSKETFQNGYIWHSTGSGKTLTSFITSKNLRFNPNVYKVLFVVDRKDLDTQTQDEFNSFETGSIDNTNSSKHLYSKLISNNNKDKLIITTIQKLDRVLTKERYIEGLKEAGLQNQKVVLIFDECHRSQFGKTHREIKKFFKKHQMFGFTGTPIFNENKNSSLILNSTTADLFGERLHTYNIKNAIADNNILKFSIEYYNTIQGKYYSKKELENKNKKKDKKKDNKNKDDKDDKNINTTEKKLLENTTRISNISSHIVNDIKKQTQNLQYNAIFATSNIPVALKYYKDIQSKNKDLKIAIIYSIGNQNQDQDRFDFSTKENIDIDNKYTNSNIELQNAANEYSETFNINKFDFNSKDGFENYRKDIARRMKKKEADNLDLLIVVDMFLTGFDSEYINTMYIDKFMKYHLLLQAFSRTNRLSGKNKTQGNIICYRDILKDVNKSIRLFSDTGDYNQLNETSVIMEGFNTYLSNVNDEVKKLREIVPLPQDIDNLEKESDKIEFVKIMKELNKNLTIATQFIDYKDVFIDMAMPEEFEDYKGKYLQIYEDIKEGNNNEINNTEDNNLQEIDFEIDLFKTDLINVDFIYKLLENYVNEELPNKNNKIKKDIERKIDSEPRLKGIKKPILEYIEKTKKDRKQFDFDKLKIHIKLFMGLEISKFCKEEKIIEEKFLELFDNFIYNKLHNEGIIIDTIFEDLPHFSVRTEKRNIVRKFIEQIYEKYILHI